MLSFFATQPTHRYELIDEIESKTAELSGNLNQDTVKILKEKITELEETNRELELQKEELSQRKKCCKLGLVSWLRWGLWGTVATIGIIGISRLAIKYSIEATARCLDDRIEILGDVETYLFFIFGAVATFQEILTERRNKIQFQVNESSMIEKFGEESYRRFLDALIQFKNEQNVDRLKDCIHNLDEMPQNRITSNIARQRLIPLLLNMLPGEDEIFIKFNNLKERGREICVEEVSSNSQVDNEISSSESSSNRFKGEKLSRPVLSFEDSNNNNRTYPSNRPLRNYRSEWKELERKLETKFDSLECDGQVYHKDGSIDTVITIDGEYDETLVREFSETAFEL